LHADRAEEVIVAIDRGQFWGDNVKVRFDDEPIQTYNIGKPADNRSTYRFIQDAANFITELRNAKRVRIEAEFYDHGTRVFDFPAEGLTAAAPFTREPVQLAQNTPNGPEPVQRMNVPVAPQSNIQTCPATVLKAGANNTLHGLANALFTSTYEQQTRKINNGMCDPHYLDLTVRNLSNQRINAEVVADYLDLMGDVSDSMTVQYGGKKGIKPGGNEGGSTEDTSHRFSGEKSKINVYVKRVRFADGSFWNDNGSHSCGLTVKP